MTGACGPAPAMAGTSCTLGVDDDCHGGTCDGAGTCNVSPLPDGTACNDHDACTMSDQCTAGVCGGAAVVGCTLYSREGFENCPDGWTLGGDWQCGTPMNVGPALAHSGHGVIATQIAGDYSDNQSFATTVADSPAIDLTMATQPTLSFWVWYDTEDGTDGWNLEVSTDGGATFTDVTTVIPVYDSMIAGRPAWSGDRSAEGWENFIADLTAFAGHSIILRFAFQSDAVNVFPGVYIDDVVVAEPPEIPLYINPAGGLSDTFAGAPYSARIIRTGGSSAAMWSIAGGGTNAAWLSIDPATGVLQGTPSTSGPVSLTVRVEEPTMPSNFFEQAFTFNVYPDIYYTSFEGPCPDGWTLLGDWACGLPMNMAGPATAAAGAKCIGTGLVTDYSNNDTWAATTATSPSIMLAGTAHPTLTFLMWLDTEGGTFDGANLQISTDGGITYSVVATVTPAYPLMIANEPAWGGHQGALGWQHVTADLSAWAGQTVRLRFAFQSDAAGTFAGVYIDDFLIH